MNEVLPKYARKARRAFRVCLAATGILCFRPASALACAACYGAADSPMAKGMNWGILSLLVVVVGVLGSVAGFFIYLARRSDALSASLLGSGSPATAAGQAHPIAGHPLTVPITNPQSPLTAH